MAVNPTYVPIQTTTVSGTSTTSITFSNIPQDYTDLVIQIYARTSFASQNDTIGLTLNGLNGTYYSNVNVSIADASYLGNTGRGSGFSIGSVSANSSTAGLFGTITANIFNYSNTSTPKTVTTRYAADYQNASAGGLGMLQGTFHSPSNAPITTAQVYSANGAYYFFAGSIITLYGIKAAPVNTLSSPKATGGSSIGTDGTYWYHGFFGSGSFIPSRSLTCDVLVVGGGGSGGGNSTANYAAGGGGGGGAVIAYTSQSISTTQTVTIGAGGSSNMGAGSAGGSTQFGSLTAAAGGGAGGSYDSPAGGAGSSGGGGAGRNVSETNLGGTASNGGTGGTGYSASSAKLAGGGGGGAAGAGGNGASGVGGGGGYGYVGYQSWFLPIGLQSLNQSIGAGGGGGAGYGIPGAPTQAGYGGNLYNSTLGGAGNGYASTASNNGGYGYAAMPGSGSGGGGAANGYSGASGCYGGMGGSGLVIVRYAV